MSTQTPRPQSEPGKATAPPAWGAVPPLLCTTLLDPESWRESLDAYAHATHLAVALVDVAGHLLGPCYNSQPTWSRLHAAQGTAGQGCPFALWARRPCTCIQDAIALHRLVLVSGRTGLVH